MSDYTPTTEEVREAISEWVWSRRMFRPEFGQSDGREADRWLAEHDRQVAERAWDEGRSAVIAYAVQHVENEPEHLAGYIDQHIVGVGGSKLSSPYRKEQS